VDDDVRDAAVGNDELREAAVSDADMSEAAMDHAGGDAAALFALLLRLGDSDLILAQRLGEWVGKGPVLEEDIALANVGLDLLGQARLWLAYAGEVEARMHGKGRSEDELAFLRDAPQFRNALLAEQPNGDFAHTMARQLYFDHAHHLLLRELAASADERVAAIAAKAEREVRYHVERSSDWVVRLGDGTAESHARMQRALDVLWPWTGEMFMPDESDRALAAAGIAPDPASLRDAWHAAVAGVVAQATLRLPDGEWMQGGRGRGGREGVHTEHLGHLLAEMQFLQRAYPGAKW
jgi:ring-1,2-phenylacetyl-CoA epoxidase subunit PaaC